MISAPDRRKTVELIEEAVNAGVSARRACEELGISQRTYQRWTQGDEVRLDQRPEAERPEPTNKLTAEECEQILDTCNDEAYCSLPPSQIIPALADDGIYLASEATFYRVLKRAGQLHHRGKAQAPRKRSKPPAHRASGPNQVWSWDIERHEALSDRAMVRDHRGSAVAAARYKLRAARTGERRQGWQAALTKPGHGSTVRCCGSGEQTRQV